MGTRNLPAEHVAAARQRQLRRRAKRGLVAGYIHELSVRHRQDAPAPERREPALAVSRSA